MTETLADPSGVLPRDDGVVTDFDLDTIRISLHILAASVWVGGQVVMASLVPVLRSIGPDVPRRVANRFGRVAWPFFGLAVVTGIWNLSAIEVGDREPPIGSIDGEIHPWPNVDEASFTDSEQNSRRIGNGDLGARNLVAHASLGEATVHDDKIEVTIEIGISGAARPAARDRR